MFYQEVYNNLILYSDTDPSLVLGEKYTLDQYAVQDIKSVLKDQQEGIQVLSLYFYDVVMKLFVLFQALVQCVKEDLKDLEVIMTGLGPDGTKQG